jgi:Copper transport outer membrane protein, MctB
VIDFRYHLVSIVAVFLALAVGVVLGSAALNGPVVAGLRKSVSTLRHEEDNLGSQNRAQRDQIKSDQLWAQAAGPVLLNHLLTSERVVIVTAPGAPGAVTTGITQTLAQAGAKITGQVNLEPPFFDTAASTRNTLSLLTQRLTPGGMSLRGGTVQAQAAQLIASAILTQDEVGQPLAGSQDATGASILSGFDTGGFLSVSAPSMVRATLAVVIIPASPPATNDSNPASQALVTLSKELDIAGLATVVAGSMSGSGPGSAIQVIRSASPGTLSTVDNADTASGQIVVAQALYEVLARAKPGSYGTGPGATAVGPTPMPTPSPTVSPSTSAHASASPSVSSHG